MTKLLNMDIALCEILTMKLKSIFISIALLFPMLALADSSDTAPENPSKQVFFSLEAIKSADKKELAPLEYLQASDGTSLAFRTYLPSQPKAILIFYHGAGAHSGLSYNHIGVSLRDNFNTAVYMPDLRGHGSSGGARGDAPSDEQVWSDISVIVKHARMHSPNLPLFIGGHSGGAGLVLNYASWDQHATVDGYVFLAPYFGFRSETEHENRGQDDYRFSSVKVSDFIINTLSGGLFRGHAKAVRFNFPSEVLAEHPEIVPFNTVNMANAVTPHSPDTQFAELSQFGLWIGSEDEAFDPLKVTQFARDNSAANARKEIKIIKDADHFSVIVTAADFIGSWLTQSSTEPE